MQSPRASVVVQLRTDVYEIPKIVSNSGGPNARLVWRLIAVNLTALRRRSVLQKFRSIQALRGIAACGVVVLHARYFTGAPTDNGLAQIGGAGVDLFFVISGFIMASIARPSVGTFLFDRAWRILPLWFIAVTPWILWKQPDWPVLLSSLTLWPIYDHFTLPALIVGWTLSFEWLFYLSIALAMRTRPLLPLALFGVAVVAGAITHAPVFDLIGNPMIFEFLFGVMIARLPRARSFGLPLLLIGVAGLAVAPLSLCRAEVAATAAISIWRVIFWGIPAALLVYACLCLEDRFTHRIFAPLMLLGDASYSIYLFHCLVTFGIVPWPFEAAGGICLGIAAYWFVERPLIRLKPGGASRMILTAPVVQGSG
jgi:exopolysaccharide production protein ExoZ